MRHDHVAPKDGFPVRDVRLVYKLKIHMLCDTYSFLFVLGELFFLQFLGLFFDVHFAVSVEVFFNLAILFFDTLLL